jgi:hypothetical protein
MKQKLLLLTLAFLFLGSVSFHQSIACDPQPKKKVDRVQPSAKKKASKTESIPFDVFPFVQTILLN